MKTNGIIPTAIFAMIVFRKRRDIAPFFGFTTIPDVRVEESVGDGIIIPGLQAPSPNFEIPAFVELHAMFPSTHSLTYVFPSVPQTCEVAASAGHALTVHPGVTPSRVAPVTVFPPQSMPVNTLSRKEFWQDAERNPQLFPYNWPSDPQIGKYSMVQIVGHGLQVVLDAFVMVELRQDALSK
ncbi:hypothetical protein HDU97_001448 [Phlyctochytrium planicorne]|nr:hypothetical protein HDU97_001448 [Phlyctochytrium planicorne]